MSTALAQHQRIDRARLDALGSRLPRVLEWPYVSGKSVESWDLSLNGATAVVGIGTLRLHGIGKYPTAETTLTLTGSTDWIYLKHTRNHDSTTIEHQATEPVSDASAVRIPLWECTALATGIYSARSCRGDINMGSPL